LKATLRNLTGRSTSGDDGTTSHVVVLGTSGSASGRMISPVGSDGAGGTGGAGGKGSIDGTAQRDSPSMVGVFGISES